MKRTWRIATTWDGRPIDDGEIVRLELHEEGDRLVIEVWAPFHDDPPPPGPPGPHDRLWAFEVVEVFVVGVGEPVPYTEIELSPHGHHLVLQLRGARQVTATCLPLELDARIDGDRWYGRATLAAALLPREPVAANAFAIHGVGGARRHLAMCAVPGPTPDFHRLQHFGPWDPCDGPTTLR